MSGSLFVRALNPRKGEEALKTSQGVLPLDIPAPLGWFASIFWRAQRAKGAW